MKHLGRLFCIALLCSPSLAWGEVRRTDSDSVTTSAVKEKVSLIDRIYDYFERSNDDNPNKRFDISFIGGPHYSQEAGVGLGIVGSGRYRHSGNEGDELTPYSNVSLKFDVSTNGFYEVGAEGYHIFPHDKFRINYDTKFYYASDKFWGIGYDNNRIDDNESRYDFLKANLRTDILFALAENIFIGQRMQFEFGHARHIERTELFDGQDLSVRSMGLGLVFMLDTRDYPTGPEHGVLVQLSQTFHPRTAGCQYKFSVTSISTSVYHPLWQGATLASMAHARLTYGNTPWCFLSTIGGSKTMRGYYEGRYRDKNVIDATVELRQKVWRRNGLVVWGGAAVLFANVNEVRWRRVLPNWGVGYRWEFKKHVNVRLDLGFGRGQKGVNFSINEAF